MAIVFSLCPFIFFFFFPPPFNRFFSSFVVFFFFFSRNQKQKIIYSTKDKQYLQTFSIFYFRKEKGKKSQDPWLCVCVSKSHLELTNESLSLSRLPVPRVHSSVVLLSPQEHQRYKEKKRLQALSDPLFHPSSFIAFYIFFFFQQRLDLRGEKQLVFHSLIHFFFFFGPLNFVCVCLSVHYVVR